MSTQLKVISRTIPRLSLLVLAVACCSCTQWRLRHEPHNPLATWVRSGNHNARDAVLVVIHATEQNSVEKSLDTLRGSNASGRVSAHYLIGRGELERLPGADGVDRFQSNAA